MIANSRGGNAVRNYIVNGSGIGNLGAVEATDDATGGGDGTEPEALTADVVIAVVDDESIEN